MNFGLSFRILFFFFLGFSVISSAHAVNVNFNIADWQGTATFLDFTPPPSLEASRETIYAWRTSEARTGQNALRALLLAGSEPQEIKAIQTLLEKVCRTGRFKFVKSGADPITLDQLPSYYVPVFLWTIPSTLGVEDPEIRIGSLLRSLNHSLYLFVKEHPKVEQDRILEFPELQGELLDRVNQALDQLPTSDQALSLAAQEGYIFALKFLSKTRHFDTPIIPEHHPLLVALQLKHRETIPFLLQFPRIRQAKGPKGITALHFAAAGPDAEFVQIVHQAAPELLWIKDDRGELPLQQAIQHSEETALYLISKITRQDVERGKLSGEAPVLIATEAIFRGYSRFFEQLMTLLPGLVKRPVPECGNLLHVSVTHQKPEIIRRIMAIRPQLASEPDPANRLTPFELALVSKNGTASIFLKSGFKPSDGQFLPPKKMRQNALHVAALTGDSVTVQLLLEAGLNPSLRDSTGQRPEDLATSTDVKQVFLAWHAKKSPRTVRREDSALPSGAGGSGHGMSDRTSSSSLAHEPSADQAYPALAGFFETVSDSTDSSNSLRKLSPKFIDLNHYKWLELLSEAHKRISKGGELDASLKVALAAQEFEAKLKMQSDLVAQLKKFDLEFGKGVKTNEQLLLELEEMEEKTQSILAVDHRFSHFKANIRLRKNWILRPESKEATTSRTHSLESVGELPEAVGKAILDSGDEITAELMSLSLLQEWASRSTEERERIYSRIYPVFQTSWAQRFLPDQELDLGLLELENAYRLTLGDRSQEARSLAAELRAASDKIGDRRVALFILVSAHPDFTPLRRQIRDRLSSSRRAPTPESLPSSPRRSRAETCTSSDLELALCIGIEEMSAWEAELDFALSDRSFRDFFSKLLLPNKDDVAAAFGRDFSELKRQLFLQVAKLPSRFDIREGEAGGGFVLKDRFAARLGLDLRSVGAHMSHGRTADYGIDWNTINELKTFFQQAEITPELIESATPARGGAGVE